MTPGPALADQLRAAAAEVARLARITGAKLVLAESCTAGLVAQSLSTIPAASDWLCGSAVVYRSETKTAWLRVPAERLEREEAVNAQTAEEMCRGVLSLTPEATLAASVTGHLGPAAPTDLDGVIYIDVQPRGSTGASATRHILAKELSPGCGPTLREYRQQQAALLVLEAIARELSKFPV